MKKKNIIILLILIAIFAISILIFKLCINENEENKNNTVEQSKVKGNILEEQKNENNEIEKKLILDNIVIEGKTYKLGELTLSKLEEDGFHIDYDNSGLYIDEENNKMYTGYDGQHPELLLTAERNDAKYIMQPGKYNNLEYRIVKDNYTGMTFQGNMFDKQYCPMELNIQNWSSNEEKNYKDCDVTSISFGTTSKEAWNNEEELLKRFNNYPDIKINGIGLMSNESDILKTFGNPSNTNDYNLKTIQYYNNYQSITFSIYNGKVCNIDLSLMQSFYK